LFLNPFPDFMQRTQMKLENAASGLLMMSESDYPFTYFSTEATGIDDGLVLGLAGKPAGTRIEKIEIGYLLRNMADPSSGSVNQETARKFINLSDVLKQELSDLAVYRIGEIRIEVLIIGLTREGKVAGMHTTLIET
jgi:hypothetical protein